MKNKFVPIVIFQTISFARSYCDKTLTERGLVNGKDFLILSHVTDVEAVIADNQRQLYISGSFNGIQDSLAAFIQKLRDKNPQLVCLSYSTERLDGPFDGAITKRMHSGDKNLPLAILAFQTGVLRRSEAMYEGKPFSYEQYERVVGSLRNDPQMMKLLDMVEAAATHSLPQK